MRRAHVLLAVLHMCYATAAILPSLQSLLRQRQSAAVGAAVPLMVGRRLAITSIVSTGLLRGGAPSAGHPQAASAFPPPVGNIELLVPMLQCRDILAERRAAFVATEGTAPYDWRGLQRALSRPPFTQPAQRGSSSSGTSSSSVGSGFRAASVAYDASLTYTAEIDDNDRAFCYVSKAVKVDTQCVQRLYTSDRAYRELLRNAVLTGIQEVESEAGYLAQCAATRYASSAPVSPRADGIDCRPEMSDTTEMARLFEDTLASFEKLFASVGKAELKAAAARLATVGVDPAAAAGRAEQGQGGAALRCLCTGCVCR